MDAKKTILQLINPNPVLTIILLLPPLTPFGLVMLLCNYLPTVSRAKKNIAKLEAAGNLDKAAAELTSAHKKQLIKDRVVFTENFIFCKNSGFIFTYDEVLWTYQHRMTQSILFIPVQVTDSLYIATKTVKPKAVASMNKDKTGEIKNAILEIYNHNNKCLVGYTDESAAYYRMLSSK